jgi:hypothetical protein
LHSHHKALYGLKQANRQWYTKMGLFLCEELGFTRNAADHCFYVRMKRGQITLITLYLDDLLIACADKSVLDTIKRVLSMKFEMKDMGVARKCLGLEIFRKDGILTVSQSEYAKMVLARYEMAEVYSANTPMECGVDLNDASELAKDVPYRGAIGSLMYLGWNQAGYCICDVATIEICGIANNSPVECSQKSDEVHQTNGGS